MIYKNIMCFQLFEIAASKEPLEFYYKNNKYETVHIFDCYFTASDKTNTKYVVSFNYYQKLDLVYISFTTRERFIPIHSLITKTEKEQSDYENVYATNTAINYPFTTLSNILYIIEDFIIQYKYLGFKYIGLNADSASDVKNNIYKYYIDKNNYTYELVKIPYISDTEILKIKL